jgi:hypothetical protein
MVLKPTAAGILRDYNTIFIVQQSLLMGFVSWRWIRLFGRAAFAAPETA